MRKTKSGKGHFKITCLMRKGGWCLCIYKEFNTVDFMRPERIPFEYMVWNPRTQEKYFYPPEWFEVAKKKLEELGSEEKCFGLEL